MKKKLLIFGSHEISELATFYFNKENKYNIEGYVLDDEYIDKDSFLDKPLIPYSEVKKKYSTTDFCFHVAISFKQHNQLREKKYKQVKNDGYDLISYIDPNSVISDIESIGENCFILENQTIQPNVKIGDNVVIWSGNHIGHGSLIGNHAYISSHVVISGHVEISERVFLGVNTAIKDFCKIGKDSFITMGANVTKDINEGSVVMPSSSIILEKDDKRARLIKKKYFF